VRSHAVLILYYDLSLVFRNIFESFLLFWYLMDSPSKAFFQDFVKWVRTVTGTGTGLSYMYAGLSNFWLCRYTYKLYLFFILSRDLKKTKALYVESSSRCLFKFCLFFAFLLSTLLVRLAALVLLSAFCLLFQLLPYHLSYKMWLHQVVFFFSTRQVTTISLILLEFYFLSQNQLLKSFSIYFVMFISFELKERRLILIQFLEGVWRNLYFILFYFIWLQFLFSTKLL